MRGLRQNRRRLDHAPANREAGVVRAVTGAHCRSPVLHHAVALLEFVDAHAPVLALTGAGLSTGSGIPAYRDAAGQWTRPAPVTQQDFLRSLAARRRYWARSLLGWPHFAAARPNAGHCALTDMARHGVLAGLVTQNVDGLHERAGSVGVVALHGGLERVLCLDCNAWFSRAELQERLVLTNPRWRELPVTISADGEALPDEAAIAAAGLVPFQVPACAACGGLLKPDVVFFGANVPPARAAAATRLLDDSRGLLVVGSSLSAYSGYRICRAALVRGLPVAVLSQGWTRADGLPHLKLDADCVATLARAQQLGRRRDIPTPPRRE